MKKITLVLILITSLYSCSNNETENEIAIPQKLIGSWQFKGIYSHDVYDENNMPLYTPYENGSVITFNSDKTFSHFLEDYNYTGTFSVTNEDKLNFKYNPNPSGMNTNVSTKIALLTETELRFSCLNGEYCDVARYEKITPN